MTYDENKKSKLEKKVKKLSKRLEELELTVSQNSVGIQQASQVIAAGPTSEEEKQVAAEEAKDLNTEMIQNKELSLDQEFDLLLKKLTTQTGKYEPRLGAINLDSMNKIREQKGGLELAILLLRAEDNLNKIVLNETWSKDIEKIRHDPIIQNIVKAVEETSDKLRSQIGFWRSNYVDTKESIKSAAHNVAQGIRYITPGLKMKENPESTGYSDTGKDVNTDDVNKSGENKFGGGGRKTQRRKKHKKSGKHDKTRKHH